MTDITKPKITVITICYNSESELPGTIENIEAQDYAELEYLIIDGASTDNTVEIIKKYKNKKKSCIHDYISEKDSGVSEAFNKGINKSTGDYILFLNAGDFYVASDTISKAVDFILQHPDSELIFARTMLSFIKNNQKIEKFYGKTGLTSFKLPTAHQGFIYKRKIFDDYGLFDLTYKYAMDYEHYLRFRKKIKWSYFDKLLVERPMTENRNSFANPLNTYQEYLKADITHKNPGFVLNLLRYIKNYF